MTESHNQIKHWARTQSFDDLYSELQQRVKEKKIFVQTDGESLEIFNYSPEVQFKKTWDEYTKISRGLVLDVKKKLVVATPLPKFFNLGEHALSEIPDLPFEVFEKCDGSLGIIFYHNKQWKVCTRGSFTSPQSQWATSYLHNNILCKQLQRGTTYCAEIIYPENQIVISYHGRKDLVLLGCYAEDGKELCTEELDRTATTCKFSRPKTYNFDKLEQMVKLCKTLSCDEEGFVVRFSNGFRVKIKGEEYLRRHRIVSNITPLRIWDMLRSNDDMAKIREDIPDEMIDQFDEIVNALNVMFKDLCDDVVVLSEEYKDLPDRELGIKIQEMKAGDSNIMPTAYHLLFQNRKYNLIENAQVAGHARDKIFTYFRPKDNKICST